DRRAVGVRDGRQRRRGLHEAGLLLVSGGATRESMGKQGKKGARFFRRPAAGSRGRRCEAGQRSGARSARKGDVPPGPSSTGTAPLRCGVCQPRGPTEFGELGGDPGVAGPSAARVQSASDPWRVFSLGENTPLRHRTTPWAAAVARSSWCLPAILNDVSLLFAP